MVPVLWAQPPSHPQERGGHLESQLLLHAAQDWRRGYLQDPAAPPEAESIQRWLAKLPLSDFEYKGEGLPGITQRLFCALLRAERRSPAQAERQRILLEQDAAATCAGAFLTVM